MKKVKNSVSPRVMGKRAGRRTRSRKMNVIKNFDKVFFGVKNILTLLSRGTTVASHDGGVMRAMQKHGLYY